MFYAVLIISTICTLLDLLIDKFVKPSEPKDT